MLKTTYLLSEGGEIEIPHPVIAENGTSLHPSGSTPLDASGSVPDSGSAPLGTQDSQVAYPRRRGKKFLVAVLIEGDIFMCTKVDEEKPASFFR